MPRALILWVASSMVLVSCDVYDPDRAPEGRVLTLEVEGDAVIPANGVSEVILAARINADADADKRTVEFSTEAGTFPNGKRTVEVVADTSGLARTRLRSAPRVDTLSVVARVGGVSDQATVVFTRVLAETLTIDPGSFALSASYASTTTIVATLRRSVGVPTTGAEVTFVALDSTETPVGHFRLVTASDSSGRATALYTPGPTEYRGPVSIRASTAGSGGPLMAEASVEVIAQQ